jgi:hypothetical protein
MRISRVRRAAACQRRPFEVIKTVTLFAMRPVLTMSAKFYFYFFWHLKPLADREG